jgi:hypothetical protein
MGAGARLGPGPRRRALAVAGALTLGVGFAASGCAELWIGDVEVDEVALWGPSTGGGDSALLEGILTVEGGCVYVVDAFGRRWLPVFNEDRVGWDGETLRTPDGAFVDGDGITVGGGVVVESAPPSWEPPDEMHVPASCGTELVWSGAR